MVLDSDKNPAQLISEPSSSRQRTNCEPPTKRSATTSVGARPLSDEFSAWRWIAAAAWKPPVDPTIHGLMAIDFTGAEHRLREIREKAGLRVTPTHLVAWALTRAIAENPAANAQMRLGRVVPRKSLDICLQVSLGGDALTVVLIRDAQALAFEQFALAVQQKVERARSKDHEFTRNFALVRMTPQFLLPLILRLASFIGNDLGIHLPALGIPRDPFGSAMITSLGMHGIDIGYAPLFPLARSPILLLVGQIQDRPWVADGQVAVRRVANICATFDHRVIDGVLAGRLAASFRQAIEQFVNGETG